MGIPRRWIDLAALPGPRLAALQDVVVARHFREELLPFGRAGRELADAAGLATGRIRGVRDLAVLGTTTPADLAADPEAFALVPTPAGMRSNWSFGRKFAVAMGGARARVLLRAAYASAAAHRIRLPAGQHAWIQSTAHDIEVAGETAARSLEVLGLTSPGTRVLLASPPDDPLHLALTRGGAAAGVAVASTGGPTVADSERTALLAMELDAHALVAEPPFAAGVLEAARSRGATLRELRRIVLTGWRAHPPKKAELIELALAVGAEDSLVCNLFSIPETRLVFPEAPAPPDQSSGFVTFPDLALFEVLKTTSDEPAGLGETGELVFSTTSQRGTALLRYRTGLVAPGGLDRAPCPHTGRALPRIPAGLKRR